MSPSFFTNKMNPKHSNNLNWWSKIFALSGLLLIAESCGTENPTVSTPTNPASATMLAIGDSVFDFNREENASIPDVVAQRLGTTVANESVGGAYLTNTLEPNNAKLDIRNQYSDRDWDWLIMNGGANDVNDECGCGECTQTLNDIISSDGLTGALPTFVDRVTERGTRVIFMGYYDLPPTAEFGFNRCNELVSTYEERIQRLATRNDRMWFVDASQVIDPNNLALFQSDRVHPSIEGAKAIGDLIAEEIIKLQ
ncbi:MAG: SGNH/GDSL hydrolase family protein [Cyanobacteria bacterium J06642_2]